MYVRCLVSHCESSRPDHLLIRHRPMKTVKRTSTVDDIELCVRHSPIIIIDFHPQMWVKLWVKNKAYRIFTHTMTKLTDISH